MNYCNGGEIHIGDCVWWDGGIKIGYILKVLSTESELADAGLDVPSILISLSDTSDCGAPYVAYPQKGIIDDGIQPLLPDEIRVKNEVLSTVAKWLGRSTLNCCGIGCEYRSSVLLRWIVVDYSSEGYQSYEVSPPLDFVGLLDPDHVSFLYKPLNSKS